MTGRPPLSPIPEVDEEAIARQEVDDIKKDLNFTVMMGGEDLLATTIYIHNVNKAIKKRIEQYNSDNLTKEEATMKLKRFVDALHSGLRLIERTYYESIELTSEGLNYFELPQLPELVEPFKSFLDNYVEITKKQLQKYIDTGISQSEKEHKAEGLQQEILELVNAMLRITNPSRQLNITDGSIVGGKKSRRKRKMKRTRKN